MKRFFCNLAACGFIFFACIGLISTEALWRRVVSILVLLVMAAALLTPEDEGER